MGLTINKFLHQYANFEWHQLIFQKLHLISPKVVTPEILITLVAGIIQRCESTLHRAAAAPSHGGRQLAFLVSKTIFEYFLNI